MSENKSDMEPTPAELQEVVASGERLRSLAAFYIKLDAALFAGLGTLITIANPAREEIVRSITSLNLEFTFLITCLGAALLVHHIVSIESVPTAANIADRRARHRASRWLLVGVLVLNGAIISGATGYIRGNARAQVEIATFEKQRSSIEWAVGRYRDRKGHVAPILDSAFVNQPLAERMFLELNGSNGVRYEVIGTKEYRLTFASWDKEFGTSDDYVSSYADWTARMTDKESPCPQQ